MAEAASSPMPAGAPEPVARPRGAWRRKCAWGLGGAVAVALLLLALRAPLLRGAAHGWMVNDPVEPVDAIVALPQISGKPLPEAARLYRDAVAPRIVMPSAPLRPTDRLGLTTPFDEQNLRLMRDLGVAAADFQLVGEPAATAHAAAQSLAAWAKAQGVRSVLVVTEQLQTRRVKWAVARALAPLGVTVRVRGVPAGDYPLEEWWRHEQGLIHFENEVVLHCFYRLNH